MSEFSSGLSGCVGLSPPVGKRKSEGSSAWVGEWVLKWVEWVSGVESMGG